MPAPRLIGAVGFAADLDVQIGQQCLGDAGLFPPLEVSVHRDDSPYQVGDDVQQRLEAGRTGLYLRDGGRRGSLNPIRPTGR